MMPIVSGYISVQDVITTNSYWLKAKTLGLRLTNVHTFKHSRIRTRPAPETFAVKLGINRWKITQSSKKNLCFTMKNRRLKRRQHT